MYPSNTIPSRCFVKYSYVFGKFLIHVILDMESMPNIRTFIPGESEVTFNILFSIQSLSLFTVRKELAKVMFLHLSVCPQGGLPQCILGYHPPEQAPPSRSRPPLRSRPPPQQTATIADGTHPTGMHSCSTLRNSLSEKEITWGKMFLYNFSCKLWIVMNTMMRVFVQLPIC